MQFVVSKPNYSLMKFFTVCSLNSLRESLHRGNNSVTLSSWARVVASSKRCPQAELRTCSGVFAVGLRPILPDTNSKSLSKRAALFMGSSFRRVETVFCVLAGVGSTTLLVFWLGSGANKSPESEAVSPNKSSVNSKAAAFFLLCTAALFNIEWKKGWWSLANSRLVNKLVGASRGGRSELSEQPRLVKSECLHESCK